MERLGSFILEQWILFLLLFGILIALLVNFSKSRLLGYSEVKPDEAVRLINHEDAVVIDTRPDEEFSKGHILNAINVPAAALNDRIKDLERYRGRPFLVYCLTGRPSAHAGAALRKNGFEPVFKLSGGLMAWERAGLPLSRA